MESVRRLWNSVVPINVRRSDQSRPGDGDPEVESRQAMDDAKDFPAIQGRRPLRPVREFLGGTDQEPQADKQTMRIEIPTRTIVKVVATLVVLWLLVQVLTIVLLIFLALLISLALLPLVRRLEVRGMPRVLSVVTVYALLLLAVAGFFGIIVPPLVNQIESLINNAPEYAESFEDILARYPTVQEQVDNLTGAATGGSSESEGAQGESQSAPAVSPETVTVGAQRIFQIGANLVGGVANAFFVFVLSIYLLIEGKQTWGYFSRFMTPTIRYRFHRLTPALSHVVSGYFRGQAINSTLFGLFTYITLRVLDVPEPLLLAVIAAATDAIPIVGVLIATFAAVGLSFTVSWQTALIVLALFIVYQQFENYVLIPRVFGNTLQVSGLSILIGVLVGGQLLGVLGIILALPLTAAIPVIERVWREIPPDGLDDGDTAYHQAGTEEVKAEETPPPSTGPQVTDTSS